MRSGEIAGRNEAEAGYEGGGVGGVEISAEFDAQNFEPVHTDWTEIEHIAAPTATGGSTKIVVLLSMFVTS